ncbi:MAG: hypothetical protein Q7R34_04170, partial [Dehalococcoidia bacterium]|nr:hypothetical protein [Dehalococcoidia bacterium]
DFIRKVPMLRLEDLEKVRSSTGDPFSGRKCQNKTALLAFQLETGEEAPLYIALNQSDLRLYAQALGHCWRLLGLTKGDRVAIFDYGSSPISYLASSAFMPYLYKGAAEELGCIPLCNDGVSQMSQRAIEIVRFIRPRVLFIRSDCLFPFSREVKRQGISLPEYIEALVVTEDDGIPSIRSCQTWADALDVPVYRLLRVDVAMFLGVECPHCHFLHINNDLYFVEAVQKGQDGTQEKSNAGLLTITNLFARMTPTIRYVSQVRGVLMGPECTQSPEDRRVQLV